VRPAWLTAPNLVTFFRLALVPVFIALHATSHAQLALLAFAVAMASDVVDGLLARVLHQQSKLGGILDPVADKLLVLAALGALLPSHRVPVWLLALILFRDGMMAIGALVVKKKKLEIPTAPTRIGKYATFSLALFIVLALIRIAADAPRMDAWVAVVGFIAGLCVAVSTVQYFARWGYLFTAPARRA
jgi:cardiolipin synthase (CMP-forming)